MVTEGTVCLIVAEVLDLKTTPTPDYQIDPNDLPPILKATGIMMDRSNFAKEVDHEQIRTIADLAKAIKLAVQQPADHSSAT